MKKIFLSVMFAVCAFSMGMAQKATLLDVNQSRTVNLVVDFSQASIHNLNEEEFATYEPAFLTKKGEVITKLADEFNESGKVGFMLGNFPNATYSLRLVIVNVSRKGNVISNADMLDADGNIIASVMDMHGDGGTFGSKMNLMGDGFKSTGKVLAKRLAKQIKSEAKRAKKAK